VIWAAISVNNQIRRSPGEKVLLFRQPEKALNKEASKRMSITHRKRL